MFFKYVAIISLSLTSSFAAAQDAFTDFLGEKQVRAAIRHESGETKLIDAKAVKISMNDTGSVEITIIPEIGGEPFTYRLSEYSRNGEFRSCDARFGETASWSLVCTNGHVGREIVRSGTTITLKTLENAVELKVIRWNSGTNFINYEDTYLLTK